jgi:5-methylcytosine-specific restriction endonuclease McrA
MHLRTLVLDQGYQPLHVIPWQRAICMGFLGKVEIVTAHQRRIRTVDRQYPAPSVVRLLGTHRAQARAVRFSREAVHARDGYTCQYCGTRPDRTELTLDHVHPRRAGGTTVWTNVVSACAPCNRRKGGSTLAQAGMRLARPPARPRWAPPTRATLGVGEIPRDWRMWLREG